MPSKKLSDTFLQNVKAPPAGRRVEYFDTQAPGLALRVSKKDEDDEATKGEAKIHKSWCVFYRAAGKLRRYTFGTYPEYSLEKARDHAREARRRVREGFDPGEEKRTRRDLPPPEADTFGAAAQDYLARYVKKNTAPSTYRETKRLFEVDIIPRWRDRPVASVTRRDVIALLDKIAARGAEVQANRTLARLRTFFRWAVEKDRLAVSPVVGMRPPTKEQERDRVLGDDEILWFWNSCGKLDWPFGPLCKLLLLTAQRRDEVGGMAWSEVDLDKKLWTIPRERAKNKRAHEVQLSEAAVKLLQALPRIDGRSLVFSTTGETAVSGFSRAKTRLDKLMRLERRRALELPEKDDDLRAALKVPAGKPLPVEIPDWILHDLRRTAATGMASINIPPHVVDKILNHVSGTIRGVAAVYNRFEYGEERRAALEAWGRYVTRLVEPEAKNDNVTDLADARAAASA
jgi:integrase